MKRVLLLCALLLTACAGRRPPSHFLPADSPGWNDWMNTKVDVDFTNVPLGALSARALFRDMDIVLHELDPEYRVTLKVERVTRRQALWMLANKYGLSMSASNGTVVITPRQLRRENKPLN